MQVLVGTHVVLANGGIMAPVGTHIVALAAKHHSCPFVVLTGLHKLSPLFPHDPSVNFNEFGVNLCIFAQLARLLPPALLPSAVFSTMLSLLVFLMVHQQVMHDM